STTLCRAQPRTRTPRDPGRSAATPAVTTHYRAAGRPRGAAAQSRSQHMTENQSNRGRGRTRWAAGRPSGEPAPATAVQFTEPKPGADGRATEKAPSEKS